MKSTVQLDLVYETLFRETLLSVSSLTLTFVIVFPKLQVLTMSSSNHSRRLSSTASSTSHSSSPSRSSSTSTSTSLHSSADEASMITAETVSSGLESKAVVSSGYRSSAASTSSSSPPRFSISSIRSSAGSVAGSSHIGATNFGSSSIASSSAQSSSSVTGPGRSQSDIVALAPAELSSSTLHPPYKTRTVTPTSSHSRQSNEYTRLVESARRPVIPTLPNRPRRSSSSIRFHEPSYTTGISGRTYRTAQVSPVRSSSSSSSIRLWPALAPRRRR